MSETNIPTDLTTLTPEQLNELITSAVAEFDDLIDGDNPPTAEELARATALADAVKGARAEVQRRESEGAERSAQREALRSSMNESNDSANVDTVDSDTDTNGVADASVPDDASSLAEMVASVTARAMADVLKLVPTDVVDPTAVVKGDDVRRLNPTMTEIRARAPRIEGPRSEAVLVASADIPGFTQGGKINDGRALGKAIHARARMLPEAHGNGQRVPIASFQREHAIRMGPDYDASKMTALLSRASDMESLVAAGGWCAPSRIDYDLFNIVCVDGLLDLPTVGIERGGIRWPVSPTFAEIVGSDGLWRWTETQDVAAVTGTDQSGEKTCTVIPCPEFLEERLACDGLCLTAGNLMSDAYPEVIDNYLELLQAAHRHKVNGLRIAQLIAASVAVSGTAGLGEPASGVVANVLGALELQAIDYRELFRMCEDAVVEVIAPRWLRGAMRSDLRRRTGVQIEAYADAMLMELFNGLNVRVQWVSDWQTGTAGYPGGVVPALEWPDTVQFLMFAPGTFVLGEGMTLDLGIIRDSTLNATNDFTAAWMEECWLIAQRGHQSRLLTVNICPNGTTGAANYVACSV